MQHNTVFWMNHKSSDLFRKGSKKIEEWAKAQLQFLSDVTLGSWARQKRLSIPNLFSKFIFQTAQA